MGMNMDAQKNILIAGAGKIGCTVAAIFSHDKHARVTLIDLQTDHIPNIHGLNVARCDINHTAELIAFIQKNNIRSIVSTLPYYCNKRLAEIAKDQHCHYFDVTEDVETTRYIFSLADKADTAFVPQCGVAPGLINIIANHLIQQKTQQGKTINAVKLYCGALPQKNDNALGYAITWSTDGLINEYGNMCRVLDHGVITTIPGLSAHETLRLNSDEFEAFATSGGAGTLLDTYQKKVQIMFYKTLRYPGHCEKMRFLMYDLKLNEHRDMLKTILENALPKGADDVVITHVCVDDLFDTRRFYPKKIADIPCSAIQTVTSTSLSIVVDIVMSHADRYHGPVKQEDFKLNDILTHPYARYFQ